MTLRILLAGIAYALALYLFVVAALVMGGQ